ncbi:MAG: ParB/RepB/Spo0J family partition protein [Roseiflexaceae bacterium]
MQIIELNPHDIIISNDGIREEIGDVSGLAATIADQGLLQPLGVIKRDDGAYQLIYGQRRCQAAKSLGLTHVPCLVFADEADRNLIRQLTENLQRRDLNDLEQARAFARLRQQFARSHPDADEGSLDEYVGSTVGLSPRSIRRYLGLLDLDESIQNYLRTGQLTVTQAQHLRRITDSQTRLELARAAVDEGMSAAELSRLANYFNANPTHNLDNAMAAMQPAAPVESKSLAYEPLAQDHQASTLSASTGWEESGLPAHAQDEIDDDERVYLRDDTVVASSKFRQLKIKSLDQMVDETDRLLRTYSDGQLQRWLDQDENAPVKVGMMMVQLRRLLDGLRDIARTEQWPIDGDE